MSLKDELEDLIYEELNGSKSNALNASQQAEDLTGVIWEYLQDKLGVVQDKLLNDLTMARTERDALQRKNIELVNQLITTHNELDRVQNR